MTSRLLLFAALFALIVGCKRAEESPVIQLGAPPPRLQKYWELPPFTLTERSGRQMASSELKGKVSVASFFFTSCPGPCEKLNNSLAAVQHATTGDDRLRLVSITGDPDTDIPAVLTKYAERFHADPRWLFLTGAKADIHRLARDGFKLPIAADPTAPGLITHSTRIVLIDREGIVRGFYEGAADDRAAMKDLLEDLRTLLAQ